jgi:flagellar basal-body rod protein FlgF
MKRIEGMLRGIDTATSGMIALQRRQDSLTNNLANAETPGYKQDASLLRSFPEMLLERIRDNGKGSTPTPEIGKLSMGVYTQETLPLFSQGSLVSTNMPFDLAIQDGQLAPIIENNRVVKPSAFFAVQTADGGYHLTRNGHFSVNESGQLTTATGDLVLGKDGTPISSTELLSGSVTIRENGDIIAHAEDATRATTVGSLGLVIVNNPNQLVKTGNGNYQLEGADPSIMTTEFPAGVQIKQNMLEQSNVDTAQTITSMMTNMRLYEANQKVLQAYDKTLEQLNTIGRV